MTTTDAGGIAIAGPERPGGQGLDANQEESGNRAIYLLLSHSVVGPQTDFVATYRDGAYEVWAQRGMVRFQRVRGDGEYEYRVVETVGANPIENQDPTAVSTIEEELEAAARSGYPTDDPNTAYIEPEQLSYPYAYERIAQLFDSPNAPDLVINPKSYAFGRQRGQHGALDVIQSRAPLIFSGPGVRPGRSDTPSRHIDIAPTIARLMGFPCIDGKDATGRPSSDVYFRRQDGRPLDALLALDGEEPKARPERAMIFLLDGTSNSELHLRVENEPARFPNLRRLIDRGHALRYGSITNFPSITWPSHNAIGTSCWSGHHDIVNPTYYLRDTREVVTPQGQQFDTGRFLSDDVETLYEAFHRVYGPWQGEQGALTAAIHEPCTRGADHSVLERRLVGDRDRLRAVTQECDGDSSDRWGRERVLKNQGYPVLETRGVAQVLVLFSEEGHPPPAFVFHEFALPDAVAHDYGPHHEAFGDALEESDRRIGRILRLLDEQGRFDSTLFIVTSDHGMAAVRTELAANQGQLLPDEGMKVVVTMPLVYVLDMAVELQAAADGRTATLTVLANDPDTTGDQPPVADAEVRVSGHGGEVLARAHTDSYGVAGVALPVDVEPHDLVISVHHADYNPRHHRLDGSNVTLDLRELLYSGSSA
ncbi:MAG: alkaline phosphatase family protein [Dehalococcoidia bacterium]